MIVGGKIVKVPPRGPIYALLQALVALDSAEEVDHPLGEKMAQQARSAVAGIARDIVKGKSKR